MTQMAWGVAFSTVNLLSLFARPIPADPANVEFGMRGENMFFKIGNQSFLLDYKPAEPGEFEFMQKMLLSAFSSITPCVKTASEPVNARLLERISEAVSAYERFGGICTFEGEPMIHASTLIEIAEIAAEAQQAELVDERVIDRTWVRFCGAFGDGPDAPYPGMIAAFETHYGQSFRDKEWRTEAACWAAAWSKATARAEASLSAPQSDALEQVRAEEREACAKACDELFPPPGEQMAVEWAAGTIACANAIRARGHK